MENSFFEKVIIVCDRSQVLGEKISGV